MLTNVWKCSVMFLKLLQLHPRSYFRHRRNTKGFTYDRVGVSAKGTDAMGATRHLELGETPCGTEVLGQEACWGQPVESRDGHVKCDVTAFRLQLCASHACLWSQVMHISVMSQLQATSHACLWSQVMHVNVMSQLQATSHACLWSQVMDRSATSQLQSCMEV